MIWSSRLLFMMFLQIVPNLFSEFCASAMKDYTDYQRRSIHHRCNIFVVKTFVITQNEHLAGSFSESRDSLANECLQLAIGVNCFRIFVSAGNRIDFALVE